MAFQRFGIVLATLAALVCSAASAQLAPWPAIRDFLPTPGSPAARALEPFAPLSAAELASLPGPLREVARDDRALPLLRLYLSDEPERDPRLTVPALRAIEGLSYGVSQRAPGLEGCVPSPTAVDYVFTSTSVTRDGFGVERDRQSLRSNQRIIVAGIFETFARRMIPDARPVQIPGSVAALATLRLAQQAGCNGPEFRRLMRNVARVAGSAGAFDQAFPAPAAGAGGDWLGFVAACVPSVKREARRAGQNWSHNGSVETCVCIERSLALDGDAAAYARFRANPGPSLFAMMRSGELRQLGERLAGRDGRCDQPDAAITAPMPTELAARMTEYLRRDPI